MRAVAAVAETDRAGEKLVNQRLAYVAVSRGRYDAQIYADDKRRLARVLGRDVSRRSALEKASEPFRHDRAPSTRLRGAHQ